MIFFFGTRNSTILTEKLADTSCTYCKEQDTVFITVFSSYFHIFWIPIFPVGKKYFSHCLHCKQTLSRNQMPFTYKDGIAEISKRAKVPLWQFIGLILISIPILFGLISIIFAK
ncbi:zinc-ribbon domain-containing protein [Pedobacter nototheniae]|uniref:zinc-ribbon domain-containing protein n=1 Tax=Pedobacter nototheniae TaxID=2488994 RepID=UPI00292F88B6|nr:zinc-ribbon domain-containing protein [Pedobacter nototheniae]